MRETGGYIVPFFTSSSGRMAASALAAHKKKESGTSLALMDTDAKPTPGKMNMLLPCPGVCVFPSMVTGSKGEPAANRHFPLLQVYASKAVISAFSVGFD